MNLLPCRLHKTICTFSLHCSDPPLEDDGVPIGEWLCHRCRMHPKTEVISLLSDSGAKSGSVKKVDVFYRLSTGNVYY